MKLVITEKPSQAMAFANVLGAKNKKDGYMEGNGWIVSWCLGHLVRLCRPDEIDPKLKRWRVEDLPLVPQDWRYIEDAAKKKQLDLLKKLMHDSAVKSVVCATDAGREGELIFRLVYDWCGCKLPVERLWINSMEDSAIAEGFANLRPMSKYENLYQAALCRSRADWLIGINLSRLFSALCHKRLTIGRVQSPTLAMLVERDRAIQSFQPVPYHQVHLSADGLDAVSGRIMDKAEADKLVSAANGGSAVVKQVDKVQKTSNPPILFDLTALQRAANRQYGYTAKDTLDIAQRLYEKRLLSYPRTDSKYITNDMLNAVHELVFLAGEAMDVEIRFEPDVKRLADDSKVSDHYALLPTKQISVSALEKLSEEEYNVMALVLLRLMCAVGKPHIYEETTVLLDCDGTEFTAKGKRLIQGGWKNLLRMAAMEDETDEDEPVELPMLGEGQSIHNLSAKRSDHKTTPPKQHTEDTLLSAMEHAANGEFEEGVERSGLGTPATRAGMIDKLITSGYVQRKGKSLIPTEIGCMLVDMLPAKLRDPAMTAEWENDLLRMERGEVTPKDFMFRIEEFTLDVVGQEVDADAVTRMTYAGAKAVGKCPRCGNIVYEQPKGFFCSGKGCNWALWRNSGYLEKAGIKLTAQMAEALIADGHAPVENVRFADNNTASSGELYLVEMGGKCPSFKYKKNITETKE